MARKTTPAAPVKARTKRAALVQTPTRGRPPKAKPVAEPVVEQATIASKVSDHAPATPPKPLPGSGNRFNFQSISPADAYHYAALATGLELDFGNDEKQMRRYRSRLYAINKEFAGKWRFRTIREAGVLMIWRLAY